MEWTKVFFALLLLILLTNIEEIIVQTAVHRKLYDPDITDCYECNNPEGADYDIVKNYECWNSEDDPVRF